MIPVYCGDAANVQVFVGPFRANPSFAVVDQDGGSALLTVIFAPVTYQFLPQPPPAMAMSGGGNAPVPEIIAPRCRALRRIRKEFERGGFTCSGDCDNGVTCDDGQRKIRILSSTRLE